MQISERCISSWTDRDASGATIELPDVDITKIKAGDDILVKVENITLLAISDGLVIKGNGYRIHEPKIIAHFPQEKKDEGIKLPNNVSFNADPALERIGILARAVNQLKNCVAKLAERRG